MAFAAGQLDMFWLLVVMAAVGVGNTTNLQNRCLLGATASSSSGFVKAAVGYEWLAVTRAG